MKKALSLILAFVLLFSVSACVVSAHEQEESVVASYRVPDSFLLMIPLEISMGCGYNIEAEKINIADDQEIVVSIGGLNDDGSINLTNPKSSQPVVGWFEDATRSKFEGSEWEIGRIDNANPTKALYFGTTVDAPDEEQLAGVYTGVVEFRAVCSEKQ